MTPVDVLFAGATGMVGAQALPLLLRRAEAEGFRVFAVGRRTPDVAHDQLVAVECDTSGDAVGARVCEALERHGAHPGSFVCALGTTISQAGSREAFARVDHDLVVALARAARVRGATQAVVVSSGRPSRASTTTSWWRWPVPPACAAPRRPWWCPRSAPTPLRRTSIFR